MQSCFRCAEFKSFFNLVSQDRVSVLFNTKILEISAATRRYHPVPLDTAANLTRVLYTHRFANAQNV